MCSFLNENIYQELNLALIALDWVGTATGHQKCCSSKFVFDFQTDWISIEITLQFETFAIFFVWCRCFWTPINHFSTSLAIFVSNFHVLFPIFVRLQFSHVLFAHINFWLFLLFYLQFSVILTHQKKKKNFKQKT